MKWFKHYSNASDSQKLTELRHEMGLEGYAYYWLLLEILAYEFDGKDPEIRVHKRKLKEKLGIKFDKKLAKVLQKLTDFSLTFTRLSGNFYIFDGSILLDLQSKDFKYSRLKRKLGDPKNKDIKNKEIKKKSIKKELRFLSDQDLENLYAQYPKKVGKASGNEKLRKKIKSAEDLETFRKALSNYLALCEKEKRELKFIKGWSVFVNQYEDYLDETEVVIDHKSKLLEKINRGEI